MAYHDEDEIKVIGLFREAGGTLMLSPTKYWDPTLPTKRLKDAMSRLVKKGVVIRGMSFGSHGRGKSYIRYHLREPMSEV